jgi:hypothetical protein
MLEGLSSSYTIFISSTQLIILYHKNLATHFVLFYGHPAASRMRKIKITNEIIGCVDDIINYFATFINTRNV